MTDVSDALRVLSGEPLYPAKRAIARAASAVGFDYWRAFDIWYGKARVVQDFEREAVAAALEKKRKEDARNELHELRTRLVRLESLLARTDPDFYREEITYTRKQLRTLDGKAGA